MKRGLLLILLLSVWNFPLYAAEGERPALVVVSEVTRDKAAETTRITGNLYFERTGQLSAEVSGKAEEVFFNEGHKVKKGEKLLKIDTLLLEKELALELSRLSQLEINLEKAKKDFMRYEELYNNDAASESSYDDLKFNYQALLEEKSGLMKTIDMTKIKLDKSTVYAPFTGIILEKNVEKGNWVQPGASVCRIGNLDSVSVKVPVSEKFIRYSDEGDMLDVELIAVDKKLKGKVTGFIPYADPKTRNLYLKLGLKYNGKIAENMSAIVDVPSSEKRDVFVLPRDAVVSSQGNKMVYAVDKDKPVSINITIAGYRGKDALVNSVDLKEGMKVIVEGNERLGPDQSVKVIGEK